MSVNLQSRVLKFVLAMFAGEAASTAHLRTLVRLREQFGTLWCLKQVALPRGNEVVMFEDSMMESGGQIKTTSKYWMIASFTFWGIGAGRADSDPAAQSRGVAVASLTASLTAPPPPPPPTAATPSARGSSPGEDGLRAGPGPACADQDSQRHQDDEGRCSASAQRWCGGHGYGRRLGRTRRRLRRHGPEQRPDGGQGQASRSGAHLRRCDAGT